ncbi:MAG TPA: SUKH-3 domain-containing protein [Pilimelia sp.]|nr:SUKH-3 domain-containing protein [Pilimelia sp.]
MISLHDVERVAAAWARRESLRRGHPRTPLVSEFDVGYVVWTREPHDRQPLTGDGVTRVIDKETGRVSTWPCLPSAVVKDLYRRRRADLVATGGTADPVVALRREAARRPTPTVAAHLTARGRAHVAHGAKGDQQLRHHPLVRGFLRELPAGELVRGCERHAELVVLSDVLHAADAARGTAVTTEAQARGLLAEAHLELYHVREPRDPVGGTAAAACATCVRVLVHLGVLPWDRLPAREPDAAAPPAPVPGCPFPPAAVELLAEAGWSPGREPDYTEANRLVTAVCAVSGQEYRHQPFPGAVRALAAFAGLAVDRARRGARHWVRPLRIDPLAAAHTADVLAECGARLGGRLFPLGVEGAQEAVLAVDERGRVFAVDQGGEWFLGDTLAGALGGLLSGEAAAVRVRDDGTWGDSA